LPRLGLPACFPPGITHPQAALGADQESKVAFQEASIDQTPLQTATSLADKAATPGEVALSMDARRLADSEVDLAFALQGSYCNFTTAGQWLWDEYQVMVPAGENPYPLIEKIRAIVAEETGG
jgi:hypothetical protein